VAEREPVAVAQEPAPVIPSPAVPSAFLASSVSTEFERSTEATAPGFGASLPTAATAVEAGLVGGFLAPSFPVPPRPVPVAVEVAAPDENLVVEEQMMAVEPEFEPEFEPVVVDETVPIEAGLEQSLPVDVLVAEEQLAAEPMAEESIVEEQLTEATHIEVASVADVEPVEVVEDVVSVETESVTAAAAGTADLRARIEETRRRIQRELEHPFTPTVVEADAGVELAATMEDDQEYQPPIETVAFASMESATEVRAPVFVEADAGEPELAATIGESAPPSDDEVDRLIQEADAPPAAAPGSATEFDHDAMRRRIEETRNRLKAKAFDAMMSGEGSLLSKSGDKTRTGTPTESVALDSEVDETIEATLTEEEF
jgi:hypothetical protein